VASKSEIPRLRKDLQFQYRDNDTVDVRDPRLLQIYTLDADDFRLAREFDGSDAETIRERLRTRKQNVTRRRLENLRQEYEELYLLDTPESRRQKPMVDNTQPYSQIFTQRGLKVLPVAEEDAKWTCHGCGDCCHGLAVELSEEEESRIDASLYQDILKGQSFAEDSFINPDEAAKRTLRQRSDDLACIFLADDGRCYVHARQGMQAKPDACQMFPAMVMSVPNGPPRLGVRTNCGSMHKSSFEGPSLQDIAPHIGRVIAKGESHKAPREVKWFKRTIPFERFDRVLKSVRRVLLEHGVSAETIAYIDEKHLGSRVKRGQRRFGKLMIDYIEREASGPAPVEEGAYGETVRRARNGRLALEQMRAGKSPPMVRKKVERFLARQVGHVMYLCGPLNLPDAGFGLVGIMLGLMTALHSVGEKGGLPQANMAFEVFMGPYLETMEHSWPMLDAIDRRYAERLRKEL
jgi:Fe-S-cluster containining protein